MKVVLQPALVLHTRAWRDTSLLVELFTRDHGRVAVVAKGAKRSGKRSGSGMSALLQPFTPILCSWSGRSDLKNLTACESRLAAPRLVGKALYCGLYLNEILARLLQPEDANEVLFTLYEQVLQQLAQGAELDLCLREFEYRLLIELGYGFELDVDGESGEPIQSGEHYQFHPDYGLTRAAPAGHARASRYGGDDLLRWSAGEFDLPARRCAKRLMREALRQHLGDRPLKSRELFHVH
ncbi:DNA repair protein RecO [Halieaceae bacterium IMCC14734]|uniref:DNA repair protein RecO n=1 Tax=Candidatus Litorirhabdus singularis TaxID=2518993 RepID=A0ABT3TI04_9GAMM|nr:DNA repair protein RecO [Candidatus Litorirhabdus singularis]MCX2981840.1 DNA repair protein RecO [Candidatus Litorirhabdus singularis]